MDASKGNQRKKNSKFGIDIIVLAVANSAKSRCIRMRAATYQTHKYSCCRHISTLLLGFCWIASVVGWFVHFLNFRYVRCAFYLLLCCMRDCGFVLDDWDSSWCIIMCDGPLYLFSYNISGPFQKANALKMNNTEPTIEEWVNGRLDERIKGFVRSELNRNETKWKEKKTLKKKQEKKMENSQSEKKVINQNRNEHSEWSKDDAKGT